MPVFKDQTGRSLILNSTPTRIISLVPSQTELLYYLDLDQEIIGITKFCVHPINWFQSKPKIGGTKQVNMQIIHQLKPDLIIANKEENEKEQVEKLASEYPVWVSDIHTLDDARSMIREIGMLTGKEKNAHGLIENIDSLFRELKYDIPSEKLRTAYLIWRKPYMTVGGNTFIDSMMQVAGFENVFGHQSRYPEVTIEELQSLNCELILLSSEPFPFKQKHIKELQPFFPGTKILLVDGEMFSWYGSRLLLVAEYFKQLYTTINTPLGDE
jgi:ABC-type Fe3+-hydroxamate transport system substrate-binding protein